MNLIETELGADQFMMLQEVKKVKAMVGVPQAKMPYAVNIH
jgi:protease-4